MFLLDNIIRSNFKNIEPDFSLRDEIGENAKILLDANENGLGSPLKKWYNRYPGFQPAKLKTSLSFIKKIDEANIFLSNGSNNSIDVLFRCFCEPKQDNIIVCPPTSSIYQKCAAINNVEVRKATLLDNFQLDLIHLENLVDANTKIIFICSPNNPTGNAINRQDIEAILNNFSGLVVVDETYINFSKQKSFIHDLEDYPNLIVLQTLSKAWGLAGLHIAFLLASKEIISIVSCLNSFNQINEPTQEIAAKALEEVGQVNDMIKLIVEMRNALAEVLQQMPIVEKVFASEANFLLVKFFEAKEIYNFLLQKGILVADKLSEPLCNNCLRISIGTEQECTALVDALIEFMNDTKSN